jgi:peroxiredoxin
LCRERAAQVRAHESALSAAGARLVFVSTGAPAMAADFANQHAGGHAVLSDAGRIAFTAAGMRRSLWSTLRWRTVRNAWRAFRRGHRQGRLQGDAWQQGGVVVFDARGRVLHHAVDQAGGDELDVEAILAAVRTA